MFLFIMRKHTYTHIWVLIRTEIFQTPQSRKQEIVFMNLALFDPGLLHAIFLIHGSPMKSVD